MCHPSGARNFEVAPAFVENLGNPDHDYDCVTFRIRALTTMINVEKTNENTNKQTNKVNKTITVTFIAVFISATIRGIYYVLLIQRDQISL